MTSAAISAGPRVDALIAAATAWIGRLGSLAAPPVVRIALALLRPVSVILMGSLAVSALTSVALSMFHPLDATVMVLGWNLGTAVLFTGLAALFGRRISSRNDRRSASERD